MRISKLNDVFDVEDYKYSNNPLSAEDYIIQSYTLRSKKGGYYSLPDYSLFTIENESAEAIIQVLVHPDVCIEYVYDVFATINPQADDFTTTDSTHRDNAPLFVVELN